MKVKKSNLKHNKLSHLLKISTKNKTLNPNIKMDLFSYNGSLKRLI